MNTKIIPNFLMSLAVLAFVLVATVQAQDPKTQAIEDVPVWVQHIGEQLGEALESPVDEVRHEAMQHIAYFAYFYRGRIDLTNALPNLLETYKNDGNEQCRLLSLAAIHAIGNDDAMQEVREYASVSLDDEKSFRVRLVTLAALMQYYGEGTFEGDEETARMAKALLEYYTGPRVIVEPPVVIDIKQHQ